MRGHHPRLGRRDTDLLARVTIGIRCRLPLPDRFARQMARNETVDPGVAEESFNVRRVADTQGDDGPFI